MKILKIPVWQNILFTLTLFLLLINSSNNAVAESAKASHLKIGVVNMDIIMKKSIAAQNIRAQVSKKRSKYQAVIKKRESELLSFQKGVLKEQDNLKESELTAKKKLFKQKLITAQKNSQNDIRKIDKAVAEALKKLRKKSASIVADIAKSRGFEMVLSHQQVILALGSLDITQEVLKQINKEMKSVPISWK